MTGLFDFNEEEIIKASDARYGKLGQFFTPEPVANLMAQVGRELTRELYSPVIVLDPAAGEGALLAPFREEEKFELFAVEIDPGLKKKLTRITPNAYTKDGLSILARLAEPVGTTPPVDLIIMNPPYNLQITLPGEAKNFICARREYGTSRLVASSEIAFVEAGLRIVGKSPGTALISVHTETHREKIEELIRKLALEEIYVKGYSMKIGKAFPGVDHEFFVFFAVHKYYADTELSRIDDKESFLYFARIDKLYNYASTYNRIKRLKNIITQGDIEKEFNAEEILPSIELKGLSLRALREPLLLFYSSQIDLQHPLTDEEITIPEALRTSLLGTIAEDGILATYFAVEPEKIPPPAELVSLSPPTPLQQLAFASPGIYTAAEDLLDGEGKPIIEKGKKYLIKNIIKQEKITTQRDGYEIVRMFKTRVIQVISPESNEVLLEVQI